MQLESTMFEIAVPTMERLQLLGDSILVARIEDPTRTRSPIIIPNREEEVEKSPWAVVAMVGPGARVVTQPINPNGADVPHAQFIGVGDLVIIKSFGGTAFQLGTHALIILKPEHVLALFPNPNTTSISNQESSDASSELQSARRNGEG